ncbi:hypothetical protein GCM10009860_21920 [Microbacterium mitrae]|uniref:Uncharacterized protein n=1 Tax=Microbacterium mitrae TaxID=664640 RepID=A0A5C8HNA5_9MICO|nr:hypothetical protein [Microbacterium mitrae]TXK04119.1 hypothetical protein FVP60_10155 [Microbacterium mitrae]
MPVSPDGDGSSSICTQPPFRPISYHWYGGAASAYTAVWPAVRAVIDGISMPEIDRERLRGETRARLVALKNGTLTPVRHIKGPMHTVTDIDVYEVRSGTDYGEDLTAQVRIYHSEPTSLQRPPHGSTIVGLHVHEKAIEPGQDPNAAQDVALQIARDHYYEGRSTNWGGATVM